MRLKELENWLTAKEAGDRLGISRQAMQKRLQEGKHRAVKTHHGWLVDPEVIRDSQRKPLQGI
jgi:predicted DNA-binding protein (UPF0251 family)